jgi:ABC-type branched-subunit amino acid transport system ATPase component
VEQLKEEFRELSKNTALVIVEQNLPLVCAIADKVYALNDGRVMAQITERRSITPEACERYL